MRNGSLQFQVGSRASSTRKLNRTVNQSIARAVRGTVEALESRQLLSSVATWHFDEATGHNTAADASGNSHTATLHGGADFMQARGGQALSLDGTTGWASVAHDSGIDLTGTVTVAGWVKLDGNEQDQKILGTESGTAGGYKLGFYDGKLEFEVRDQNNQYYLDRWTPGGVDLRDGQWHFVAGVYDQAAGYIQTYVDGQLNRELITGGSLVASGHDLVIGRETFDNSNYFHGQIADLAVDDTALSAAQIGDRYTAPTAVHAQALGGTAMRVSWLSGGAATGGYKVDYREAGASAWTTAGTVASNNSAFTIEGLSPNAVYESHITALSGIGGGGGAIGGASGTATAAMGAVNESGLYRVSGVNGESLIPMQMGITAGNSSSAGLSVVGNGVVFAADWKDAVYQALQGTVTVSSPAPTAGIYAFANNRFEVETGAVIGAGSLEGSLSGNALTGATTQAVGFEDYQDFDHNDDFFPVKSEKLDIIADLDLNFDGDTDDAVDGTANYRPGYLVDGTQLLTPTVDQDFNVIAKGFLPGMTVEFGLTDTTAYLGRASNAGTETDADIELGGFSVTTNSQGEAVMNAKNKDFAGTSKIEIKYQGHLLVTLDMTKDDDQDGLPNWWENQYGGNLGTNSDNDKNTTGKLGKGAGDKLPAFDEFRGFYVNDGGNAHHIRTDPIVKDAFLKDETSYTTSDGGGDILAWTDRLDIDTHRVGNGQTGGIDGKHINFNGANSQKAVFVTVANLDNLGSTGPGRFTTPSAYASVQVDVDQHERFVTFYAQFAGQNNKINIVYRGSTDSNPTKAWEDNGKVKIGDEIIEYGSGLPSFITSETPKTAGPVVPAASQTIIMSESPLTATRYAMLGDEVLDLSGASKAAAVVGGLVTGLNANTLSTANNNWPPPPQNGFYYAKVTHGADVEWISYTGIQNVGGKQNLTGVQRGLLQTVPVAIANGDHIDVPNQFGNAKRGELGSQAAAIQPETTLIPVGVLKDAVRGANPGNLSPGDHILYFSNVDDALRHTAAHEVGHALGLDHLGALMMQDGINRGSYLHHGFEDIYDQQQMDGNIDAR